VPDWSGRAGKDRKKVYDKVKNKIYLREKKKEVQLSRDDCSLNERQGLMAIDECIEEQR